jgi:ribosomal protein S18 acetylase RimI-like enzyme
MADTEHGKPSEELYRRLGYIEIGQIPNYSKSPAGDLRDEVFFYKNIATRA